MVPAEWAAAAGRIRARECPMSRIASEMTNRADDDPEVEVSSPACSMHEADDAYMGYAGKDELITFLNELLEAERAGARVTLESARTAGSGLISELMRTI